MSTEIDYCEHDEIAVACLDCMALPQKVAPRPKPKQKATKSPTSENELIAPLSGSLDVSVPTEYPTAVIGTDWVRAHAFPHDLRRSGWVYLRTETTLVARVRAKKVEWRNGRSAEGDDGMVITVNPDTWDESIDLELGWLASRQAKGYRYLKAKEDGSVVHYSGGKPVVEPSEEDELVEADAS